MERRAKVELFEQIRREYPLCQREMRQLAVVNKTSGARWAHHYARK